MEVFKNKIYNDNETRATFIDTMNESMETCPNKKYISLKDSTESDISKSGTKSEGIFREKVTIPNINIEEVKEDGVGIKQDKNYERHDNIGDSDYDESIKET